MLAILYGVNHRTLVSLGLILYNVAIIQSSQRYICHTYGIVLWHAALGPQINWSTTVLCPQQFAMASAPMRYRPVSSRVCVPKQSGELLSFAAGAHPLAVKRLRPKTSMQFESYVACLFLFVCVLSVCVCVVSECIFCGAPVSLVRNGLMAHSNSRARKVGRPRHLS